MEKKWAYVITLLKVDFIKTEFSLPNFLYRKLLYWNQFILLVLNYVYLDMIFGDYANYLFHHSWLPFSKVLKALSFCELYMKIFYGIKLYFSYLTIVHKSSMISSFLYLWNVLTFRYASLLPCIFALGLFLQNIYEVVLLRFYNPFYVYFFFAYLRNKKI